MKSDLKNIRAALFDLDDTLYDIGDNHEIAKRALFEFLSQKLNGSHVDVEAAYLKAREANQKALGVTGAAYSRILYIQKCIEYMRGKSDLQLSLDAEDIFWQSFIRGIRLREGAMDLLSYLRSRGIKIAVVTNLTAQVQMKKMIRLGLDGVCDILVTSEEAGAGKPDARPFLLVLEKLGVEASQAVMVGDDYEADALGAGRAGIRVIYLLTGRNSMPDGADVLAVNSFAEIKALFEDSEKSGK